MIFMAGVLFKMRSLNFLYMEIRHYEYKFSNATEKYILYTRRHKTALAQNIVFILSTELPFFGGRN